jgi:hypothetical protein
MAGAIVRMGVQPRRQSDQQWSQIGNDKSYCKSACWPRLGSRTSPHLSPLGGADSYHNRQLVEKLTDLVRSVAAHRMLRSGAILASC